MGTDNAALNHPWLSVIMPVYNGAVTIGEALQSVASQKDPGLEVVVVDDGSTDSTLRIVQTFSPSLNLKIIRHNHTGNWVSATNAGMREASGTYMCFLHRDDRWADGRLAAVRAALEKNSNAAMCFHPAFFIGPGGDVVGQWNCPFPRQPPVQSIEPDVMVRRLLVQNFVAICTPVFATARALTIGLLDESLLYTADWDFWIRLSVLGPCIYLPTPLACFRVHPESETTRLSTDTDYIEQQLRCVLERHRGRCFPCGSDTDGLYRMASFSARLNAALARLSRRQAVRLFPLAVDFLRLGPQNWRDFFRYSRIVDRSLARLRVRWRNTHGCQ